MACCPSPLQLCHPTDGPVLALVKPGEATTYFTSDGVAWAGVPSELQATCPDTEKIEIVHRETVTELSSSNLIIDDSEYIIYAAAITVTKAPVGNETVDLIDRGATGGGALNIATLTLVTGTLTTGIIPVGPYVVAAGSLVQSNILTIGTTPSEKWALTIFYRETN